MWFRFSFCIVFVIWFGLNMFSVLGGLLVVMLQNEQVCVQILFMIIMVV